MESADKADKRLEECVRDLAALRQGYDELSVSEKKLRGLIDSAPVGVYRTTLTG